MYVRSMYVVLCSPFYHVLEYDQESAHSMYFIYMGRLYMHIHIHVCVEYTGQERRKCFFQKRTHIFN